MNNGYYCLPSLNIPIINNTFQSCKTIIIPYTAKFYQEKFQRNEGDEKSESVNIKLKHTSPVLEYKCEKQ